MSNFNKILIAIIFSLNILPSFSNTCGNSKLEKGEECEITTDYNCMNGKFCSCNCMCIGTCGNGFLGSNEECDDGNNIDNDGCTKNCIIEHTYCHERCLMTSPWYIGGHVVNENICPKDEFNEWQISEHLSCCCKMKPNSNTSCKDFEEKKVDWKKVLRSAVNDLNSCKLDNGKTGNPFDKEKIKYELVKSLDNNHCGKTECDKDKITLSICTPECSTNICAKAIHEIGHFKRCKKNNKKFTNLVSCDYIAEEIIVQDESFSNCILNNTPSCNCEQERIYIIKQCNLYTNKECKNNTQEIKNICKQFI